MALVNEREREHHLWFHKRPVTRHLKRLTPHFDEPDEISLKENTSRRDYQHPLPRTGVLYSGHQPLDVTKIPKPSPTTLWYVLIQASVTCQIRGKLRRHLTDFGLTTFNISVSELTVFMLDCVFLFRVLFDRAQECEYELCWFGSVLLCKLFARRLLQTVWAWGSSVQLLSVYRFSTSRSALPITVSIYIQDWTQKGSSDERFSEFGFMHVTHVLPSGLRLHLMHMQCWQDIITTYHWSHYSTLRGINKFCYWHS
jgi:hypothetical protein